MDTVTTPKRSEAQAHLSPTSPNLSTTELHTSCQDQGAEAALPTGLLLGAHWVSGSNHLPQQPAHSPGVAPGQPGLLANLVNAKLLWAVATCYPKEHMLSTTSQPLPEAGPSDATKDSFPLTCFQEDMRSCPCFELSSPPPNGTSRAGITYR